MRNKYKKALLQNIRQEAFKRIMFHKKRGDKIILCSASPNMLIMPIADYLKIDLISTRLYKIKNKWVPKIEGPNCKGIEKLNAIEEILGPIKKRICMFMEIVWVINIY